MMTKNKEEYDCEQCRDEWEECGELPPCDLKPDMCIEKGLGDDDE